MTQKPEPISFEKMWENVRDYGAGIEDLARELYQEMIQSKVPLERIRIALTILREIKAMEDYFTENYADLPIVNSLEKKLRILIDKHTHGPNSTVSLPIENVKETKETWNIDLCSESS